LEGIFLARQMSTLERAMCRLSRFQCRYFIPIIIISLGLTALLAIGLPDVQIESDFTKILPQDIPVVVFENRISETFGAGEAVFILVRLDKECTACLTVNDIRDPRVIRMLLEIQETLPSKTGVDTVFSAGSFFPSKEAVPPTLDGTKSVFSQIPGSNDLFNRDYSATTILISASVGGGQEKREEFTRSIQDEIDNIEKPTGIVLTVTGTPQLEADIFDLLEEDAVNVTLIAGLLILALLLLILRKPLRTFQTYTPVLFSLVWTFGLLGWLDIALSVATVAIGAFIIGLGIEYGIFFVKRYEEGLKAGFSTERSLEEAVCGVGSAITSSASTTMIGFIMLTFTILPIIQVLGITIALSIFFSLVASILINPALIILEERLVEGFKKRRSNNGEPA
jgi:hydrophobe/amphiphile efflux-3 (HAE3) family protein